jgi:D-alanine-D-alanine ligase
VGIGKAHNRKELRVAVADAAQYDLKIIVEKGIARVREMECSVLGNDEPIASVVGEVISSNEFYDYDAKYIDGKSRSVIPAELPRRAVKNIRTMALAAFRALDCAGMARVDFFVQRNGAKIYLIVINTIPGFTSISMYPKLWEASGLSYYALLDKLIALAIERHDLRRRLKTRYRPANEWYKG